MAQTGQQGGNLLLTVEWLAYSGGPAVDVSGLTVTIVPAAGGAAVLGPTSTGITHPATGLYHYTWAIPSGQATGTYDVVWSATGGLQASETISVLAAPGASYATLAQLRQHLGIADTARDAQLAQVLMAARRMIDRQTGRRFDADVVASTRTYRVNARAFADPDAALLLVDDIADDTGMIVETGSGSAWTVLDGYATGPDNAIALGWPITSLLLGSGSGWGSLHVRVTTRWGWPLTPEDIVTAQLIQAARLFKRKDSPEGIAGTADWGGVRLTRVDPDVQALIAPFVIHSIG